MTLIDERELSHWAYIECYNGNNTPEIRSLITTSISAYHYCRWIRDIKSMWSKITDSDYAYWYCKKVRNRPEVRKYIVNEWSDDYINSVKGYF